MVTPQPRPSGQQGSGLESGRRLFLELTGISGFLPSLCAGCESPHVMDTPRRELPGLKAILPSSSPRPRRALPLAEIGLILRRWTGL